LRLKSVSEEKPEIAGEDSVNLAGPRTAAVLRHLVQLDEQEFCFRERLIRSGEDGFFRNLAHQF